MIRELSPTAAAILAEARDLENVRAGRLRRSLALDGDTFNRALGELVSLGLVEVTRLRAAA